MSDKSLEEKLIDKFGEKEAGEYYNIRNKHEFVQAFSILDSVKESIEGINSALLDGRFDRPAAKKGMTPIKYAELAINKVEEVSEEKATVIYSTIRTMIAVHNQYSVDSDDELARHKGDTIVTGAGAGFAPPASGRD